MPKPKPPSSKSKPDRPPSCTACAELGERFHYSFPEDKSAPDPGSFAHLSNVAHSIISFRDELVRCDVCQTYFSWDRMWDNDVYSTPLDYVDIYRLTPQEAQDWLKREKDWARKERAAERREIRILEKLWAAELGRLDADERSIFDYVVEKRSRGVDGRTIEKECGLKDPVATWKALESLLQKNIVRRTLDTASSENPNFQVSPWKPSVPASAPVPAPATPAPLAPSCELRRCPQCRAEEFRRDFGATPDGAPYAADNCAKCGKLLKWYDEWNLPDD